MKSWHVWLVPEGTTRSAMRHMDAEYEMEIIVDESIPLPDRIESCDGKGFYCLSRGTGAMA